MRIQKLLHSCLLLEEKGTRILIDPGDYSFAEKLQTPESLTPIDAILLTHNHADHCDVDAIRKINAKKIFGTAQTKATLAAAGLNAEIVTTGNIFEIGNFSIQVIPAPHDPRLTSTAPESVGYILNKTLLHPGDSLTFETSNPYTVLALPVAAPWMTRMEAIALAAKLKPAHIIPIHDGMLKDFAAQASYNLFKRLFGAHGSELHPLKLGETLEVND